MSLVQIVWTASQFSTEVRRKLAWHFSFQLPPGKQQQWQPGLRGGRWTVCLPQHCLCLYHTEAINTSKEFGPSWRTSLTVLLGSQKTGTLPQATPAKVTSGNPARVCGFSAEKLRRVATQYRDMHTLVTVHIPAIIPTFLDYFTSCQKCTVQTEEYRVHSNMPELSFEVLSFNLVKEIQVVKTV